MASSKSKSAKTKKSSKGSEKGKKLKKSKPSLVVPDAWINELSHFNINDEDWQCSVALMEEESTDASVYLEHFNESAIKGRRLAIKVISKLEIIKTVTEHMKETNPGKEITPHSLLCSEIYNVAGSQFEKKIPIDLLAPLVKYILLEYKRNNKRVREGISDIQKDQEEYRESLWQISKGKPNSSKETRSTKIDSSTNKSKKSAKGISKDKFFTKLRKRGEEWKDISWIDDAPIDGPQLYVTISTLFEPDLPLELLNFNIPLNAIIRLNLIKTPSFSDRFSEDALPFILQSRLQSLAEFKRKSTQYLSFNIGKHIDSEEMKKIQITNFWNKISFLKTDKETAQLLKHIMFLQFVPEHQDFEYEVQRFQDEIYRQVSYFVYDSFEISKRHKDYLNEMEIITVLDTDVCNLSGMFIYNSILDTIPQEVLNVPLILDALVVQVIGLTSDEKSTNSSNGHITAKLSLDSNHSSKYLFNLLDSLNSKYDLFDDSCISLITRENIAPSISENTRHLLTHGDEIRIKSFHLESGISQFVTNRTNYIIRLGWKDVILSYENFSYHDESFTKLCNEIIKVGELTGDQILYYFLYILITNSILNSLILIHSESGYRFNTLNDERTEYNKDNLCDKCLKEVNSGLISLRENPIAQFKSSVSCFPDGLSTYSLSDDVIATNLFYIEEMSSDILLQRIQNIAPAFSNVESRTCPFTDQIVLLFHNLVNPRTLDIEQHWMGKITTNIPVRDFVDYIIYEEENWLKKDDNYLNMDSLKPTQTFRSSTHELGSRFTLMLADLDYISHRSIKYQIMIKQHSQTTSPPKLSNPSKSPSKISKKSNPKNTAKTGKKNKDRKDNQQVKEVNSYEEIQLKKFKFLGYDFGDPMRFQYNGWRKDIILDDDCKVILKSMKQLYGEESRSANVHILGNDLYLNFNPNNKPGNSLENSFHLILSSGILLYFSLRPKDFDLLEGLTNTHKLNIRTLSMTIDKTIDPSQVLSTQSDVEKDVNLSCATMYEEYEGSNSIVYKIHRVNYSQIPTMYDLKMSMPSGLYTELVKYDNMLYIRQTLLTKGPLCNTVEQEKYRCCLSSGYIIKSMINGDFEVLYGNGEMYYIFKDKTHLPSDLSGYEVKLENNGILNSETHIASNDEPIVLNNDIDAANNSSNKLKKRKESNESHKQNRAKTSSKMLGTQPSIQEDLLSTKTYVEYSNYKFVGSNGECFLVNNNFRENLPSLFMSSSSDINNNCINSERIDGVKSKHLADGSLMVEFPDGSRITSTPIESEQLFSVWTPDEFEGWFKDPDLTTSKTESIITNLIHQTLDKTFYTKDDILVNVTDASTVSPSDQTNKQIDEALGKNIRNSSTTQNSLHSNETNNAGVHLSIEKSGLHIDDNNSQNETINKPSFVDDSFVVYNMSYLMEHPNYSSVLYDAQCCEIKFALPMNTHISLKNDGSYFSSFEGANLNVYGDSIDFIRIERVKTLRTITINSTGSSIPVRRSWSIFNLSSKMTRKNDSNSNAIKNEQKRLKSYLKNLSAYDYFLLYSTDSLNREIFIDYDFDCYEIPMENICNKTVKGNDFSCFVINKDLSGFRLVSDKEVDSHLENVTKEHGTVIRSENKWSSLISMLPVKMNESEKWLMSYSTKISKLPFSETRSTFGKRESWIYPFVEPEDIEPKLNLSDTLILRLLHRIPTDKDTLSNLNTALEMFKKDSRIVETKKIDHKIGIHDFNLTELVADPNLLKKIYDGEMNKRTLLVDKFRSCMKKNLLISLVHQSCIKARKRRIKNKEDELKIALRNKEIPPYHLSCFGQVHEILDKVVENVITSRKSPSHSSIYERVNCIIDSILDFAVKHESNTSICYQSESENMVVEGVIDEIFQNIWTSEEDSIEVTRILEKPLSLVTAEEIEFLCSRFEPGSRGCPSLYIEDMILQDILDARFQLSHYFQNLKNMLVYYRSRNVDSEMIKAN